MDEKISLDQASKAMRDALQATVKRHSWMFLLQAALMILAGLAAFIYPLLVSATLAVFLGWMLIIAGIVQAITLVGGHHVPHFWLQVVSTVLSIVIGVLIIRNPGVAVGTLALLLIVFFMIEGVAKVVFSLTVRPMANWIWVLVSGVLGILISLYLLTNPGLSLILLGILIGIQLVSEGLAIGWLAWQARRS